MAKGECFVRLTYLTQNIWYIKTVVVSHSTVSYIPDMVTLLYFCNFPLTGPISKQGNHVDT
jgi:hypothetical protein